MISERKNKKWKESHLDGELIILSNSQALIGCNGVQRYDIHSKVSEFLCDFGVIRE